MAGEVIVDALPYIDQGYDEAGVREAALAMVEEETRRYRPTKNYLETLPPLNLSQFETEMMRGEWERMQQRQPMDVLSMKRYELPPPPAGKMADIAAWTECAENSMAQLEHQATRICNLELMLEFGCEAWKSYLEVLVASVSQAQKNLQTLRKDIQEINWERKNAQMKGGEKLRELEATWVSLVSKNYDIEQACVQLEEEIIHLQWVKEHAAKRRRGDEDRSSKRAKREQDREREREKEREREYQKELEREELRVQQEQLQREEELRQLEERERECLAAQQLEVEQESVGKVHNDDGDDHDSQKREAEKCGGEEVEENESGKDQTSQQGDVSNDDDSNSYSGFSYSNSTSHGGENEDEDSREQVRSEKDDVDSND